MYVVYEGFSVLATGRDYNFRVSAKDSDSRAFIVRIRGADFTKGKLQYQDGPNISYRKLCGAVAEEPQLQAALEQVITDSDIGAYSEATRHTRRKWSDTQRLTASQRARERMRRTAMS